LVVIAVDRIYSSTATTTYRFERQRARFHCPSKVTCPWEVLYTLLHPVLPEEDHLHGVLRRLGILRTTLYLCIIDVL